MVNYPDDHRVKYKEEINMQNRLCKLVSCLLAIAMIIGMLPMIVSAAEDGATQVFEGGNYVPGDVSTMCRSLQNNPAVSCGKSEAS